MIKNGLGGNATLSGIRFEKYTDLEISLSKNKNFSIINHSVYYFNKEIATLYKKNSLYRDFLIKNDIDYKTILSSQLLPDQVVHSFITNTIYIIEIKFQSGPGSIDEKLQTCDFKLKQYKKLFSSLNVNVKYIYLLSDWYKQKKYIDVLDYINQVGCEYYFNNIPLENIGLIVKD